MDNKNIKRIIAREVLFGIILFSGITAYFLAWHFSKSMDVDINIAKQQLILGNQDLSRAFLKSFTVDLDCRNNYQYIGFLLITCYFVILLIRFIIWSVKTLREGK